MSMNENANIEYKQNTSLMPCQGQILPWFLLLIHLERCLRVCNELKIGTTASFPIPTHLSTTTGQCLHVTTIPDTVNDQVKHNKETTAVTFSTTPSHAESYARSWALLRCSRNSQMFITVTSEGHHCTLFSANSVHFKFQDESDTFLRQTVKNLHSVTSQITIWSFLCVHLFTGSTNIIKQKELVGNTSY
jgi:hypothetical protein